MTAFLGEIDDISIKCYQVPFLHAFREYFNVNNYFNRHNNHGIACLHLRQN
jgi:hypothetical protein